MTNILMGWFEAVVRARAANELIRLGYHEEAKKLITEGNYK